MYKLYIIVYGKIKYYISVQLKQITLLCNAYGYSYVKTIKLFLLIYY